MIKFKVEEKDFFLVPMGDNKVLETKKTSFFSSYGLCNFLFFFLSELVTLLQNLIPTKWNIENKN
jgi:hypothetical protein